MHRLAVGLIGILSRWECLRQGVCVRVWVEVHQKRPDTKKSTFHKQTEPYFRYFVTGRKIKREDISVLYWITLEYDEYMHFHVGPD